jgi:hypothetical protein
MVAMIALLTIEHLQLLRHNPHHLPHRPLVHRPRNLLWSLRHQAIAKLLTNGRVNSVPIAP